MVIFFNPRTEIYHPKLKKKNIITQLTDDEVLKLNKNSDNIINEIANNMTDSDAEYYFKKKREINDYIENLMHDYSVSFIKILSSKLGFKPNFQFHDYEGKPFVWGFERNGHKFLLFFGELGCSIQSEYDVESAKESLNTIHELLVEKTPNPRTEIFHPKHEVECDCCYGTGQILLGVEEGEGKQLYEVYEECEECLGSGKVLKKSTMLNPRTEIYHPKPILPLKKFIYKSDEIVCNIISYQFMKPKKWESSHYQNTVYHTSNVIFELIISYKNKKYPCEITGETIIDMDGPDDIDKQMGSFDFNDSWNYSFHSLSYLEAEDIGLASALQDSEIYSYLSHISQYLYSKDNRWLKDLEIDVNPRTEIYHPKPKKQLKYRVSSSYTDKYK